MTKFNINRMKASDLYALYFIVKGWKELPTKTSKYRAFQKPGYAAKTRVFVGRTGAIRMGESSTFSKDISYRFPLEDVKKYLAEKSRKVEVALWK